jgi:hypothetical protein
LEGIGDFGEFEGPVVEKWVDFSGKVDAKTTFDRFQERDVLVMVSYEFVEGVNVEGNV